MRILAADVDYPRVGPPSARAAAVVFDGWGAQKSMWEGVLSIDRVEPYEPGAFFKRELPCLLALVRLAHEAGIDPDVLVVDGYARFGPGRPALGEHLATATGKPVIGVAKTRFNGAEHREVL